MMPFPRQSRLRGARLEGFLVGRSGLFLVLIVGLVAGWRGMAYPALASHAANPQDVGGPYGGPVRRLLIDPQAPGTIYAGTLTNGLFQSTDDGTSWQASGAGLPAASEVETLVADPQNPTTLYAAVRVSGEGALPGDRVYKTVDGGTHWQSSGAGLPAASITTIVGDPLVAGTLYAATAAGLYRTADGGASWSGVGSNAVTAVTALLASPHQRRHLFAGLGRGLAQSVDGGVTWTPVGADGPLADAYVDRLVASPDTASLLFAATDGSGIFRTSDGGATWQTANAGLTSLYVFDLAVCPSNQRLLYAATADGVFRSQDGAATWTHASLPGAPSAVHAVACSPTDAAVAYAGADVGGVARTDNGGVTWTPASQGLANLAVNDLAPVAGDAAVLAATGDGLMRSQDGGMTWQSGFLGGAAVTSVSAPAAPGAPGVVYAAVRAGLAPDPSGAAPQPGGVARSNDGGLTWKMVGLVGQQPILVRTSALDPQRVYAALGDGTLARSVDGGTTWTTVYGAGGKGARRSVALVVDPRRADSVAMITADRAGNQIVVSHDGGTTWTPARWGVPTGSDSTVLTSLAIDPSHDNVLYAAGNGVYRSVDGGITWQAAGLQGIGAVQLLATAAGVFAGSKALLFQSVDRGATWQQLSLPPSAATQGTIISLAALPAGAGLLAVGTTRGAFGVWLSPAPIPTTTATPPITSTVSGLTTADLAPPRVLWYVPLSPAGSETLTLYNPGARTVSATLEPFGAGTLSPVRVAVPAGQLRRLAPSRLWPSRTGASSPLVVTVRATGPITAHAAQAIALDRSRPLLPALQWYTVAPSPAPQALWIFNMGTRPDRVSVELRGEQGLVRRSTMTVPAHHAGTLPMAASGAAGRAVAASVDSSGGQPLIVVQAGPPALLEVAVARPAATWYFARGSTAGGVGTGLVAFNPGPRSVPLTLRLCRSGGVCLPSRGVVLAARTVRTVALPRDLIAETITSTQPVVVAAGVTSSAAAAWQWQEGATTLADRWVVVDGVALFNPGGTAAHVHISPLPSGRGTPRTYTVTVGARLVIGSPARGGVSLGCVACHVRVDSTLPLVVGQEAARGTTPAPPTRP